MADISAIKSTDRKVEINHPATGAPIGVRVKLVSIDDDRLKKIKRNITDRRLYLEQRGKSFKAEEIEENKNDLTFGAMLDWEWYNPTGKEGDTDYDPDAMPDFHGAVPEFNRKNVIAVITELTWFGDQVNEAIGETKDFFDNSKPS